MKAPEKIYLERILCSNEVYDNWKSQKTISDDIEYTRTDVFIEKAWDWIENNILSPNQQDKSLLFYEQFKNNMKGE